MTSPTFSPFWLSDTPTPKLGRLLIVDDEVELLTALGKLLTNQGYEVTMVASGQQALAALQERDFDLLLTDLMMPDLDGIAVLRAGLEIDPHLLGIIMTGQGTVPTAIEAMKAGAFDYILKPFKLSAVLPVLARAFAVRRVQMENVQLRESVGIYELSQAIAFTLDLNTILNKVADVALQQCEADEVSIMLLTREGNELYVAVVRGEHHEHILGKRLPIEQGVAGWVARSHEPLVLHGEVNDPRFAPLTPRPDIRSALSLPMLTGNQLVGVLNLNILRHHHPFTLGRIKALQILTTTAAAAVKSASLYEDAKRLYEFNANIVATMAEGLTLSDSEGQLTLVNPKAQSLLGYTTEELMGQHWSKIVPVAEQPLVAARNARWAEGVSNSYETKVLTKAGQEIPVLVSATPFTQGEQFAGTLATFIDLTERRQAEEQLRKSEERYALVLQGTNDGLWDLDIETGTAYFSARWQQMLGFVEQEFPNRFDAWEKLLHAEDRERVLAVLTDHLEGRIPLYDVEFRLQHKNGTYRWIRARGVCLRDATGRPYRIAGAHTDITARKQTEDALKEETQISAALARVGQELLTSLSTAPILARLCQVTTEVLGCDCTHAILWQPDQDVYVPVAGYGDTVEQWETLRVAQVPRETVSELLVQIERAGGSMPIVIADHQELLPAVWLRQVDVTTAVWMTLRRGKDIIGALSAGYRQRAVSFTPVQERIMRGIAQLASLALTNANLFEELKQANRLKDDFLTTLSHELRTPLQAVMGYTDLTLAGCFGPLTAKQSKVLQKVQEAAERELNLIIGMLEMSQLKVGQLPVVREAVDVAALMKELREETQQQLSAKPMVGLEWRIPPELPQLYTDRMKLRTVLQHLLSNAVKFTEQGGITVDVHPCDGSMEFCVTDTGIGIAPEVQRVMFEMFRQGDGSSTRHYGGVGLGLYIVSRLLELLGGKVTVESEVGKGSTVRVWVPTLNAQAH